MSSLKIAELISELIGPLLWMPLLLGLLIFKTGLSTEQIIILFPSLIGLLVVVPFIYLFIGLKLKWVSKWDLPEKQERRPMLFLLYGCTFLALLLVKFWGNEFTLKIFILLMITGFLTSVVTFFWKISVHMVLDTMVLLLINYFFGWHLWFIFLLIPVVAWARIKLKRHSKLQILAGIILPVIIFFSGLKYFGL